MSVSDDDDFESLMYDLSGCISEDSEEEGGVAGWVPVTEKPVRIITDGVDQRLLATAREEVPLVLARIIPMISVRGRPLPAGRHLLPEAVAEWNRGNGPIDGYNRFQNGPIDGYNRFQNNVKARHSHLGPVAAIWLRLIMTMVCNAYRSHGEEFLMSNESLSDGAITLSSHSNRPRPPPVRQRDQASGNANVFLRAPMETIQTKEV
jgi:hypothetical protein